MDKNHSSEFLQAENKMHMYWLIAWQNETFIFNNLGENQFKKEFFSTIEISKVVYVLQVEYLFRILSTIYKKVCTMIKRKLDTRVHELSNSFHRFCIIKKNGKSLQIVYSLELLNRVIIVYLELSLTTKELVMHFTGKACNKILDLYCCNLKSLEQNKGQTLILEKTQENSIESSL